MALERPACKAVSPVLRATVPMGMRYQASPIRHGDHPGLLDQSVYAHSYRRVLKKAMRKFTPYVEPTGRLTGNGESTGVGRQIALATITVTVERA